MHKRNAVSRLAVAFPAAALLVAAIPAVAPAKSVKVKNGTYKGSILANSGDEGGDFRTPISITVKSKVVTKIVLSKYTLWAADQPASVSSGGQPQACQQAGTAPGSAFTPTLTILLSNGKAPGAAVKVKSNGSFSLNAGWGSSVTGSPITGFAYATGSGAPQASAEGQVAFKGRFSSSRKAKGSLTSLTAAFGAGVEQFTCNSYWADGQAWAWGIPSAPR